ncbi:EamA family transporter, partial [Nonomuraea sp. NPDC049784]|uniref:EamA family transporter n=1 Tax=Nonomuraea sp. NPDC049784 TaxID=3154361 RepID=UPI0033F9CA6F
MSPAVRGRLMLAASALGWALYTPSSKYALSAGFAPAALMATQLVIAASVLGVAVWQRGSGALPPLRHSLVRALLEPVGNVGLFLAGLAHLAATTSSLILSLEGLLTAALAALVLRERLTTAAWAGLLAGAPGLWLLFGTSTSLSLSAGGALVLAGVCAS